MSFPPAPLRLCLLAIVAAFVLASCATRRVAPVEDRTAIAPPKPAAAQPAAAVAKPSEPDWRPQSYTVKRGDTLYAIALDHGLDYRDLAQWNGIENPNRILVGQVLRLARPGDASAPTADTTTGVVTAPLRSAPPVVEARPGASATTPAAATAAAASPATSVSPATNTDTYKSAPKAIKEPYSPQAARELAKPEPPPTVVAKVEPAAATAAGAQYPAAVPAPAAAPPSPGAAGDEGDSLEWIWPTKGKVVATFSDTANLKGLEIAGSSGQPIVASAPGKVVYAGTGIRGYGKLVIIKHNKTFLSAYAHNKEILVKEGQEVARGQKIAEMGDTDSDQVKLHFEIRRLGRPMDPARYLPPA